MTDIEFLSKPSCFLESVVEAFDDGIAFYSQDNAGSLVYLSRAAEKVLNLPQEKGNRGLRTQILCDALFNRELIEQKTAVVPRAIKKYCEIIDCEGNRISLEIWQSQVVYEGLTIGMVGIFCRAQKPVAIAIEMTTEERRKLEKKVSHLSAVERQVVDFVVDGYTNRESAEFANVALRTIESRRSRAMAKLEINNISELVQLWIQVRHMESQTRNP